MRTLIGILVRGVIAALGLGVAAAAPPLGAAMIIGLGGPVAMADYRRIGARAVAPRPARVSRGTTAATRRPRAAAARRGRG